MTTYDDAVAALAELKKLTEHNDQCLRNTLGDTKLIDAPFVDLTDSSWAHAKSTDLAKHYVPDDEHDRCNTSLRDLLLLLDTDLEGLDDGHAVEQLILDDMTYDNYQYGVAQPDEVRHLAATLRTFLAGIADAPWLREDLTEIALGHSLCPIHFVDYAICFDDDEVDCAQVRLIHPSHDT